MELYSYTTSVWQAIRTFSRVYLGQMIKLFSFPTTAFGMQPIPFHPLTTCTSLGIIGEGAKVSFCFEPFLFTLKISESEDLLCPFFAEVAFFPLLLLH